ncbi:LysR family transcriptional regulator [Nocardia inohanensis]|uniref:LysR family transcriptional regulator n=1 Tax=Nocardia inohanensis TaxID=209246 RepID=UPI00082D7685|nr:LysR family transcriptional regulator [Nocardia inohanensis]
MHETQSNGTPRNLDLNLLVALDALLAERSVTGAAERLRLSEPAVSRALGRIRKALGDPVLVRAGRTMTPTPHALAIEAEVRELVERVQALFAAAGNTDLRTLVRGMTLLVPDVIAAAYGPALLARAAAEAPGLRLGFLQESHIDLPVLREGAADLEVGIIDTRAPEILTEPLFDDHMVGLARPGHPLLAEPVTAESFARARHLIVSRRGRSHSPVDTELERRGLRRTVAATTSTFTSALFLLHGSDLIGHIPQRLSHVAEQFGLTTFPLPFDLPALPFAMAWHPRQDADPAHIWLRDTVRFVMREPSPRPVSATATPTAR